MLSVGYADFDELSRVASVPFCDLKEGPWSKRAVDI
jgi:hypothetical protein